MATFKPSKAPPPIEISRFLGLNESVGETEIRLGESVRQVNFRITQDYKAEKRTGHNTFIDYENSKDVQGLWYGTIASKEVLISVNDGKVYEYNFSTETNTQIGTLTDGKTSIFYFQSKLYFLNGTDYKEYDGTTFQDVDAYVPTVVIGTNPATSEGSNYESVNLLTGAKKQQFIGDGVTTEYQLAETNIDADTVLAWVNGATKTEDTDFTVNRATGKTTWTTAPLEDDDVYFQWVKTESGNADLVKKNRFFLISGPGNDTAIFLWGNPDYPNRRSWSGTLKANYFPTTNFTLIGSNQYAITDIKPQYNRQIIFKEDRTHYSYPEFSSTTGTYDYPVYDLNEKVGNIAYNGVQIIKNSPVSLHGQSLWLWSNTNVEDERNAEVISERIRKSLSSLDLSQAVTFDYQNEKEYWLNIGDTVYIWNYGNDTFYTYDNIQAMCFINVNGVVYFGTNGTVERFGKLLLNDAGNMYLDDNGTEITAELELGFTDLGVNHLLKNSRKMWVTIQPYSNTSLKLLWETDRKALSEEKAIEISFKLMDYGDIDYGDWSYETNRNPQPYRKKIRAKKYTYIKFIFKNEELNEQLVILSVKIESEANSEVK